MAGSAATLGTAGAVISINYKSQNYRFAAEKRSEIVHQRMGTCRTSRNVCKRRIRGSYSFKNE
jgi:hypothetical protein